MYTRMVLRRGWVSQPFGHASETISGSMAGFPKLTIRCGNMNLDLQSDQTHMVSFFTLGNGRGDLAPTIGHTLRVNVNRISKNLKITRREMKRNLYRSTDWIRRTIVNVTHYSTFYQDLLSLSLFVQLIVRLIALKFDIRFRPCG